MTLNPPKPSAARFNQQDYARALRVILNKEIGVPFLLHDAVTGEPIVLPDSTAGFEPPGHATPLTVDAVQALAIQGEAQVIVESPGVYRIALVVFHRGKPAYVASAEFRGLARIKADAEREAPGCGSGCRPWANVCV